jgi:hypothetical protein
MKRHRFKRCLTHPEGVLYSGGSSCKSELLAKDSRERVMQMYSSYFAFTFRFPFAGERAGETRADKISS